MLKKLFIIPWFGAFPEWHDKYLEHIKHLEQYGYEFFITTDLDDFSMRVRDILGLEANITPGSSKSHNFRTALGLLYADKLKGYDYWGITDLDCVYGRVTEFMPDNLLQAFDIHSNHIDYICGPWTLFKNVEKVNNLFKLVPNWEGFMTDSGSHAGRWTEVEYSQMVEREHQLGHVLRFYTHHQGKDPDVWQNLAFKNGILYDGDKEIMTFHFNRRNPKKWPLEI